MRSPLGGKNTLMTTQLLNSIGLLLGMIGVLIIFKYGPPQPNFEAGVSLELEEGTPIDKGGKTVADYNREVARRRKLYSNLSKVGLALIFFGFGLQLWATWLS